ncbi:hypothetical protein [Achromobacter insolitus]|uniref:hypothetical protein n=1 Tax=Achromobacter insolitus TaxID=217204 RepID=UPI0028AAAB00|nr:hypothetical protein [Achromobacter insolitus]
MKSSAVNECCIIRSPPGPDKSRKTQSKVVPRASLVAPGAAAFSLALDARVG